MQIMSRPNVLILTDSRGSGLEEHLKNDSAFWTSYDVRVIAVKGAKLHVLKNLLSNRKRPNLRSRVWDLAVICGGICDFTAKNTTGSVRVLEYNRNPDNIKKLCTLIEEIKHQYGQCLHIATIPPALLPEYLTCHNKTTPTETLEKVSQDLDLEHQQFQLESDIQEVNDKIVQLNIQFGNQTINLAEKTYTSSVKKKKTSGRVQARILKLRKDILVDGVHCAKDKQHIWYERIRSVIENALSTNNSREIESWNYKRDPSRKRKVGSGSGQPSTSKSNPSPQRPTADDTRASEVGSGNGQPSKPKPKLRTSLTSRSEVTDEGLDQSSDSE